MAAVRLDEGSSLVTGAATNKDEGQLSRRNLHVIGGLALAIILVLALAFGLVKSEKTTYRTAVARVDNGTVQGTASFQQPTKGGPVTVTLAFVGIPMSTNNTALNLGYSVYTHGMHVHENSDLSNGCAAAGGHLNVTRANHGAPTSRDRHTGDLGNHLTAADLSIKSVFTDGVISLDPANAAFIGNRAFVIHADADDLGLGGNAKSCVLVRAALRSAPAAWHC